MRNNLGTSLTEVMVMMVILGISLTGIFGLVNSGQKLATITDTRLAAVNIAREGLESVTTLRDTFSLASFSSGTCLVGGVDIGAFFTTDGSQILDVNCPIVATTPSPPADSPPYYILSDDKKLTKKPLATDGGTEVCANEFGWYSQEFSDKGGATLIACQGLTPPTKCVPCADITTTCGGNTIQKCKTKFKRKITFSQCTPPDSLYCIVATSTVWWGDATIDETITLSQLITVK